MSFRRIIQLICLVVFLLLLTAAVSGTFLSLALDFFLRLDPVLVAITAFSARSLTSAFIPAAIVVLMGLLVGRIFCGHICPLGTTLDGGDKLLGVSYRKQKKIGQWRSVKFLVFFFLLGASFFGVSFVFAASPLSLVTRLYGLLLQPVIAFLADGVLSVSRPLSEQLDWNLLLFAKVDTPRFATQSFILVFFTAFFAMARFTPRFWCRFLCPAGALMALFSRKPFIRRQVGPGCTECGKCVRYCPMGAILENDSTATRHDECIVCLTCTTVCPEQVVSFDWVRSRNATDIPSFSPTRRRLLAGGLAGAGTALVSLTGLNSLYGKSGEGQVATPMLVRPPAALPEMEFLSRCVRCGECMAACPTNTLQPIWLKAGFSGLFSPEITARRGYCEPECHRCSEVCPTEALLKVSTNERLWAKVGTALILRQKCLAWEQQKRCMVCDEVCPFDAIEFKKEPGISVAVPKVDEDKCLGCGYCEYHCPVQNQSAIIVSPLGALRLSAGSFVEEGKRQGLRISLKKKGEYDQPLPEDNELQGDTAPGFNTDDSSGPAPGFNTDDSSGPAPGFNTDDSSGPAPGFNTNESSGRLRVTPIKD